MANLRLFSWHTHVFSTRFDPRTRRSKNSCGKSPRGRMGFAGGLAVIELIMLNRHPGLSSSASGGRSGCEPKLARSWQELGIARFGPVDDRNVYFASPLQG